MALSVAQIQGMLREYAGEHEIIFDTKWFVEQIYEYTAGYPYLVSRICSLLSEDVIWSKDNFQKTIKKIVTERSTLFDDINKNIALYPLLGQMIESILLQGKEFAYTLSDNMIKLGVMFGYFTKLLTFSFLKEKNTLTDGKENIVNGKKICERVI